MANARPKQSKARHHHKLPTFKTYALQVIHPLLARHILHKGLWRSIYRRIFNPTNADWGEFLRHWGGFRQIGLHVEINLDCHIKDPGLVSIGNNVTLSDCTLMGKDPVAHALGKPDADGPIQIRDNCFIGHGAIVMPHVTIGPDSVIAAGAVIMDDVAPGIVVGGNPAKMICTTQDLLERLEKRSEAYPWIDLIRTRESSFDPEIEPILVEKLETPKTGNLG